MKLARSAFSVVSIVNGLQLGAEPWEAATGRESFPVCLGQREAVAFGQIPSLSAASVLGAAAGLLPFCSATGQVVLVGLEESLLNGLTDTLEIAGCAHLW